ncbi:MAG: isoprenylcysteine carboxylmethyltransferase family protein [Butyricicoccus sp.]|nr:isoprenylcysteine carboxylmethyltransferase family protein [Butyricicoccus sp.]
MRKRLFFRALTALLAGLLVLGLLLFLPAGTLHYPAAWRLLGLLFVPMLIAGAVLFLKKPDLLEKRLRSKEKLKEQSMVIKLSGLMFVLGFVLAALDFRFGWLPLPLWVSDAASVVFLLAYLLYAEVLRENAYLSRTIEVQEGQKVIDTGLYGIVRHPMYSATILLFLSMPLVLGSLIAFVVFLPYPLLLVRRIRSEEQLLEAELEGYTAYKERVPCRLLPFFW